MLFYYFLILSVFLSIYGYSFLYLKIINKQNFFLVKNIDIFFGVLFIVSLSLLLNFFFPLFYFNVIVLLTGLILFFIGIYKKKFQINFYFHSLILFFLIFITYYNGPNIDSGMYHKQILNWMMLKKINFGIVNLESRFGINSAWHSFLAMTSQSFYSFDSKYYASLIIFNVLIYESYFRKNFILSDLFLFFATSYLLFFSFLHPFNNGMILNQLGNPEVDTVAMFLFIITFYIFIKNFESNQNKIIQFNLLIVLVFLAISVKISNISLFILLLILIIYKKFYNLFNFTSLFVFFTALLWSLRGFILSGCFIFPIRQTCLNTTWTNYEKIDYLRNVIQSYARDTRLRDKYLNFDYTLNSNDWFIPWFNDYLLNTSILKISLSLTLLSIFFFIILNYKNIKFINYKKTLCILFFFLLSLFIWLKAPEVRFGSGIIISLPVFLLSLIILNLNSLRFFVNYFFVVGLFLVLILSIKHISKFEISHLTKNNRLISYDQILKIGSFNSLAIYFSKNWKCEDFKEICVNTPKKKYNIVKKYNYYYFLNE